MSGSWVGAEFLINGGYDMVINALNHYKRHLRTMDKGPELEGAAMFAPLLKSQAVKTIPEIDRAMIGVVEYLAGGNVEVDVGMIERALACMESDAQKARDTGHEYYVNMAGGIDPGAVASAREMVSRYD